MTEQLHLDLEPGLARKYRDQRECFAACVYRTGLCRVAAVVDVAPSNLSQMLSGERKLDPEVVERYMTEFGDTTPAAYWAARFLQDAATVQQQAMAQLPGLIAQVQAVLNVAQPGGAKK